MHLHRRQLLQDAAPHQALGQSEIQTTSIGVPK